MLIAIKSDVSPSPRLRFSWTEVEKRLYDKANKQKRSVSKIEERRIKVVHCVATKRSANLVHRSNLSVGCSEFGDFLTIGSYPKRRQIVSRVYNNGADWIYSSPMQSML